MRTYQHLLEESKGQPRRTIDSWITEARDGSVRHLFGAAAN